MAPRDAEFAWPQPDQPERPEFDYELPPSMEAALDDALRSTDVLPRGGDHEYRALQPSDDVAGRYLLKTGDARWFVRATRRWRCPDLERTIVDHVADQAVSTPRLLVAGQELRWEGESLRVDVRPFTAARHFDGSRSDLESLARLTARCHDALRSFPDADRVQARARDRYSELEDIRGWVADEVASESFTLLPHHESWITQHLDWFLEMVQKIRPRLDQADGAQCLHGEIHPANVLYSLDDGTPLLLDFEESVHYYAPPAWDLAFIVQRFCLHDDPDPDVARARLEAVEAGYGSLPRLEDTMRQVAWHSMATIIDLEVSKDVRTPRQEVEKFIALERQARRFGDLL